MSKTRTALMFGYLLTLSFFAQGEQIFLIGNIQSDLKKDVVAHCSSMISKQEIMNCLVSSGKKTETASLFLKTKEGQRYHKLCASDVKSQPNKGFYYLECMNNMQEIIKDHFLPQLAHLSFQRNEFRKEWLATCRKKEGNAVSNCLSELENHFSEFLLTYKDSKTKDQNYQKIFIACLYPKALSNADFKTINTCITSNLNYERG